MNGIVDFEIPVTQLENLFRNVLGISLDIFNANNNITKNTFHKCRRHSFGWPVGVAILWSKGTTWLFLTFKVL